MYFRHLYELQPRPSTFGKQMCVWNRSLVVGCGGGVIHVWDQNAQYVGNDQISAHAVAYLSVWETYTKANDLSSLEVLLVAGDTAGNVVLYRHTPFARFYTLGGFSPVVWDGVLLTNHPWDDPAVRCWTFDHLGALVLGNVSCTLTSDETDPIAHTMSDHLSGIKRLTRCAGSLFGQRDHDSRRWHSHEFRLSLVDKTSLHLCETESRIPKDIVSTASVYAGFDLGQHAQAAAQAGGVGGTTETRTDVYCVAAVGALYLYRSPRPRDGPDSPLQCLCRVDSPDVHAVTRLYGTRIAVAVDRNVHIYNLAPIPAQVAEIGEEGVIEEPALLRVQQFGGAPLVKGTIYSIVMWHNRLVTCDFSGAVHVWG
eukprot:TRINITY_DN5903_c0_g1_i1.p1 TRINITY_DN5903_c0_g1~~TRINITY_DN5903_c0_g1_i1.p1  ORF type:complete len:368 (-),score=26.84 TRINITY_DN5903_c0_g1_i1:51-1154(-)